MSGLFDDPLEKIVYNNLSVVIRIPSVVLVGPIESRIQVGTMSDPVTNVVSNGEDGGL